MTMGTSSENPVIMGASSSSSPGKQTQSSVTLPLVSLGTTKLAPKLSPKLMHQHVALSWLLYLLYPSFNRLSLVGAVYVRLLITYILGQAYPPKTRSNPWRFSCQGWPKAWERGLGLVLIWRPCNPKAWHQELLLVWQLDLMIIRVFSRPNHFQPRCQDSTYLNHPLRRRWLSPGGSYSGCWQRRWSCSAACGASCRARWTQCPGSPAAQTGSGPRWQLRLWICRFLMQRSLHLQSREGGKHYLQPMPDFSPCYFCSALMGC